MVKKTYHFIGVGGIGMSGLAEILVRRGQRVSGSDLAANAITARLETLGVRFRQGHQPEHLGEAEVVVHSTAVKEDNPELAAARAKGLTVLRRGEMLARLMVGHFQIAVTGAHGKTSTTAMVASILRAGGLDPTVLVGALWDSLGSNAVLGRGEFFVTEADESDGSFAYLQPQITVITNLDREHLDYYRDLAHIQEVFARYLAELPPGSRVVAWRDDPHLAPVLQGTPHPLVTYSLHPGADFWATEIQAQELGTSFHLFHRDQDLGQVTLPLTGKHYVLNAMAACAVAHSLGLDFSVWRQGLKELGQIHRRCQPKGEAQGILVMDDYGHHPTEINTTINALAQAFPERRLVVAFQPHRYSRTQALLPDFFPVFGQAEMVFVTEIYAAGENRLNGVTGRAIYEGIRHTGHPSVHFVGEKAATADIILDHLLPGDLVLTLGAGDIWKTGEELLARLAGEK
ncbi:MAG: UDP-N-acetylmuramate--L-alanine ligase [Deltaproteobacteria bacterium]|nr:UDP-N-acetylmuramate--L-alanine ligase [Deltaproteobacteria bacterium]MBI4795817.1 UDP-N-acetylmuramate--L-alanine ligase [Deltaproteobacteria bacterium]